jgi:hypothetical protein
MLKKIKIALLIGCFMASMPAVANTKANLKMLLGQLMDLEHYLAKRAADPESNLLAPGSDYRIVSGDTLASIAQRAYGDTDVRLDLIKSMIVENNPHAFFRDNQNFIYADKVISIPSVEDLRKHLFKDSSKRIFNSQSKAHWIRFP